MTNVKLRTCGREKLHDLSQSSLGVFSHLAALAGVNTVMKPRSHVSAHFTQQHQATDLCKSNKL